MWTGFIVWHVLWTSATHPRRPSLGSRSRSHYTRRWKWPEPASTQARSLHTHYNPKRRPENTRRTQTHTFRKDPTLNPLCSAEVFVKGVFDCHFEAANCHSKSCKHNKSFARPGLPVCSLQEPRKSTELHEECPVWEICWNEVTKDKNSITLPVTFTLQLLH